MNKIAIPALLLGVVMIAGVFAFMPVQEASTVHTTILAGTTEIRAITLTADTYADDGEITIASDKPFILHGALITYVSDDDGTEELNIDVLTIDDVFDVAVTTYDPGASNQTDEVLGLMLAEGATSVAANAKIELTILAISTAPDAGDTIAGVFLVEVANGAVITATIIP